MSSKKPEDIFVSSEADRYFERNRKALASKARAAGKDPVVVCLQGLDITPRSILEIGCSTGWRLEALRTQYRATCQGIDPGHMALKEGRKRYPKISLQHGTADNLPYDDESFDLVVFGFCLYLCGRDELFTIAREADRVLMDTGYMALLDFHPPFPYRNSYRHNPDITVYKMDYSQLFLWNPVYSVVSSYIFDERDGSRRGVPPDDRASVVVLHKNTGTAYPDNPFRHAR